MKIPKAALVAALFAGAATLLPAPPAEAQVFDSLRQRQRQRQQQQQPQAQVQGVQLSAAETAAVRPLFDAVQAQDWAAASAALPAAEAGVQSPQGRYFVARLKLDLATATQNVAMQGQAIDTMLASGAVPADVLPLLLGVQANLAVQANNIPAAEAPLMRLLELTPNDVDRVIQLAQVKVRLNKWAEALALYRRALQLTEAAGQAPSEELYRRTLGVAYEGRMAQPSIELAQILLRAYPTPVNWRDSLIIYRELGNVDEQLELDLRRLMRAAQALTSQQDYYSLAYMLSQGGLLGEAKAVLDEGISRGVLRADMPDVAAILRSINPRIREDQAGLPAFRTRALAGNSGREARITGDAFYSYGQYAEAAELYRAALQKGGEDANLINSRLGAALALAGQRAEAEAAFRAVTGPRAQLAAFWLVWLASRPA